MFHTLLQTFQPKKILSRFQNSVLKNYKMGEFISDFELIPLSTVYSLDKINDQIDTLNRLIIDCLDKHVQFKTVKND